MLINKLKFFDKVISTKILVLAQKISQICIEFSRLITNNFNTPVTTALNSLTWILSSHNKAYVRQLWNPWASFVVYFYMASFCKEKPDKQPRLVLNQTFGLELDLFRLITTINQYCLLCLTLFVCVHIYFSFFIPEKSRNCMNSIGKNICFFKIQEKSESYIFLSEFQLL